MKYFRQLQCFLPQIALQKIISFRNCCGGHGKCDGRNLFVDRRSCSKRVSIENVLKRYRFAAIIYYVRFLLNGAFFYLCILSLTKNIFFQTNQHFLLISIASSGLSDKSGGLTKRGRVMEGIFWFVLLPLIFVLILSMANLSWDELAVRSWCGREMLNGSILVFALMHPIEFVWFYRGDMKDGPIRMRSFAGLMILFLGVFVSTVGSLGKKLYNDRSRTCDVYGTGSGNARRDHGKTGFFFDRILDRRSILCVQRLFILWK